LPEDEEDYPKWQEAWKHSLKNPKRAQPATQIKRVFDPGEVRRDFMGQAGLSGLRAGLREKNFCSAGEKGAE